MLLSSLVGIFCLVVLSIIVGKPFAWTGYLSGFIPFRITGGGYHAKTHFTCITEFTLLFLILLILGTVVCTTPYICTILASISMIIAYCYAPVEAINKPLSKEVRKVNRKRCLMISCANSLTAMLIWIVNFPSSLFITMYFLGAFAAGCSMLVARGK